MQAAIRFSLLIFLFISFSNGTGKAQESTSGKHLNEYPDIPYYKDASMTSDQTRLNLVVPTSAQNAPVFIWVGGGAWAYVDRNKEMDLCRKMAEKGIIMVSVGHRLSPALLGKDKRYEGVQHPAHVTDLAHAFLWVHENISEYGGDPQNIFVGGFSSGAQLATLLASDQKYLDQLGLSTSHIRAIIPVGGGYDIPHYRDLLAESDSAYLENHIYPVFGRSDEDQLDASPISFLDHFETPMLMISERSTYPYSRVFEEALSERGYEKFQVLNVHQETHASLWTALSKEENCIYRDFIVDYIRKSAVRK